MKKLGLHGLEQYHSCQVWVYLVRSNIIHDKFGFTWFGAISFMTILVLLSKDQIHS